MMLIALTGSIVGGVCIAATPAGSDAEAGVETEFGSVASSLLVVRLSGLGREDWQHAHGVPEKRAYDHFLAHGTILDPSKLSPGLVARLDRWSDLPYQDLLWLERAGSGDTSAAFDSAGSAGRVSFGATEQQVEVAWRGPAARRVVLEAQADLEEALWLNRPDVVRWEEVVEILDLTRTENQAFRRLTDESHPLVRFRSTFLRDKRRASLALYLNARYRPRMLRFDISLPEVFGKVVEPFAENIAASRRGEEGDGRYFAARVRNSIPSVAGRVDRILQSLYAEAAPDTWVILDARDSSDPFVAWVGPR